MIRRDCTLVDILKVANALPADEIAQVVATRGRFDPQDVAAHLYTQPGEKFALDIGGVVVAVGGWTPIRESLLQSWMLVTVDGWARHGVAVTRAAKRVTDALCSGPVRRMQTTCLASRGAARRWYAALGLQEEGVLRGYGVHGEDFTMHGRTA